MTRRAIVRTLAILIMFTSGMSIVGYVTGARHLTTWTADAAPPMALNTALCLLACGVSLFLLSSENGWPFRPTKD